MAATKGYKSLEMATNGYKRLHGVTVKQQNVTDRLVAGDTDEQAAQAASVHRVTVSKWRSHDLAFQAALNARRLAAREHETS